jgi:hypothetical protein
VHHEELTFVAAADMTAAAWIAPRLSGGFGAVTMFVPDGYAAYVRICHPADSDDGYVTWSEVARYTGRVAHPTMQWHAVVGSPDPTNYAGSLWPGGDPERGRLDPTVLGELCEVLARHTRTPEHCFFGVWDGFGWIDPQRAAGLPRLRHPGRDYLMSTGPLRAARNVGEGVDLDWRLWAPSPNLMWPADRAWFVGTEIDLDSTLVGGSAELIADLLDDPALDAWPVDAGDSVAADGDTVNHVP